MVLFGLIGFPLSHSFSKGYFTQKFQDEKLLDYRYENFPIENIEMLKEVIEQNPDLRGFNVTIPYKQKIIPYLDSIEPEAAKIGAVNTVKITRAKGSTYMKGFNTDVFGFAQSLKPLLQNHHKKALILGTGGASKAVKAAFENFGIEYTFVSRNKAAGNICYEELSPDIISENLIIVNTTPLGTFPDIDSYPPIPYNSLGTGHLLYDLVYNPPTTSFLSKGKAQGAQIINGLKMLHLQAEKAWEIWNS